MHKVIQFQAKLASQITASSRKSFQGEFVFVAQDSKGRLQAPEGKWKRAFDSLTKESREKLAKSGGIAFANLATTKGPALAFVGFTRAKDKAETLEKGRRAAGSLYHRMLSENMGKVLIYTEGDSDFWEGLCEGFALVHYKFNKYKSDNSKDKILNPTITLICKTKGEKSVLDGFIEAAASLEQAVQITRDWSNEPSNAGTPEYYASEAKKIAAQYGIKCKVLTESECAKEKMGMFLAVGQGSEQEGRVVVLEYNPPGATKTVALVGKGITFDSGGISIKPSMRMEDMKHDMTGAATMMGATVLAASRKYPVRIVTVLAFTENMPSGTAYQPGNVLRARNGKTVEILNTDAEGRLILGDALDLAQDYKPDYVIDAATLTGAVGIALGKICSAVLSNNDEFAKRLIECGDLNGEKIWQLPMFDEYLEDMKSDIADLRNSVNDSHGGTIRAAIFLAQFIRKDVKWSHLDIASTAYGVTHLPYIPKKGASGLWVRTLATYLKSVAEK